MILSDKTLKNKLNELGTNLNENLIEPCSLDFTLHNTFSVQRERPGKLLTVDEEASYETITADTIEIQPGEFMLASTEEYYTLPNDVAAFVQGRSSIGRKGLFIQNAGWVDAGFEGRITLELFNASNNRILLSRGDKVGQMVFIKLDETCENPYRGKYYKQDATTPSRLHLDKEHK